MQLIKNCEYLSVEVSASTKTLDLKQTIRQSRLNDLQQMSWAVLYRRHTVPLIGYTYHRSIMQYISSFRFGQINLQKLWTTYWNVDYLQKFSSLCNPCLLKTYYYFTCHFVKVKSFTDKNTKVNVLFVFL